MCGIAGAFNIGTGRITISTLKEVCKGIETRGKHAWGMSWIDRNNRIHSFKTQGKISEWLILIDRLKTIDPIAVIFHTRHSTHGKPEYNSNNHPHPSDGGWFVHNGQIPNYEDLIDNEGLIPQTECDSEVLGLIAQSKSGTLLRRWVYSINQCDLTRPLNVAGLWTRPNRAIVVRRGNPLFWSMGSTGNLYFSSCKTGLPGKWADIAPVPNNTAYYIDLTTGKMTEQGVTKHIETNEYIAGSGSTVSTGYGTYNYRTGQYEPDGQGYPSAWDDFDDLDDGSRIIDQRIHSSHAQ